MSEAAHTPGPVQVSVSIVTHNGMRWLPGLLASLRSQRGVEYELLVIDNASVDGTLDLLRTEAARKPRLRLTESDINLGYAAGHNRNIVNASGECLVLLNQDVELDADFLRVIFTALSERPQVGAVQARVRQLGDAGERLTTLDTTGLLMYRDRRVVSRGQGEVDGAGYAEPGPVWGVDGPVAAYRRAALIDARLPGRDGGWEVLDEDFFMYKEDVDLAWRLQRLGWHAWYEPAALAWHGRSASGPSGVGWRDIIRRNRQTPGWIRSLSWRNQRLMQVKNEAGSAFLRDLPWIARREILALGYIVVADPVRLLAIGGLARRLPAALRKRRYLRRRVLDLGR